MSYIRKDSDGVHSQARETCCINTLLSLGWNTSHKVFVLWGEVLFDVHTYFTNQQRTKQIVEHVARWIGRWTQDQKVWGSNPSAGYV